MPASAKVRRRAATAMRRAVIMATRRVRGSTGMIAGGGEKRPYSPRGDRPNFSSDDRPRGDGEKRPYTPRGDRGDRGDARPAARFSDRKFGDKKPYTPREGGAEKRPYTPRGDRPQGDRPYSARPSRDGDRPERKFGGDKKFSSRGAPDRGPRKEFGSRPDRGAIAASQNRGRSAMRLRPTMPAATRVRPATARAISTSRAAIARKAIVRFVNVRNSTVPGKAATSVRAVTGRRATVRVSTARARIVRNSIVPARAAAPGRSIRATRHRESGRAATTRTTARSSQNVRRSAAAANTANASPNSTSAHARPPREKKSGERIAKVLSRAGLASRRDAEEWIVQGRVTVNGRVINSPALDVTANDVITIDGKPLPPRERTRLFMYPQAARPDDHPRRSRGTADGVRQSARGPAAR